MEQVEKALAHPLRRAIVNRLDEGESAATDLWREMPGDPSFPTVAYHLAVLETAGLTVREGDVHRRIEGSGTGSG